VNLLATRIRTALALGLPNLWRAFRYRTRLKLGIAWPHSTLSDITAENVFREPTNILSTPLENSSLWNKGHTYFGWYTQENAGCPDWHSNPFNGQQFVGTDLPWSKLDDFNNSVGDIKTVWEASRFDWTIAFSQKAANGDSHSIVQLNAWLKSWILHNPPYLGPNWKCAQEASIRVLHLAVAALILGQVQDPSSALKQLIGVHLKRISATLHYAIAQDNNHGTSEAAALFLGGSWLMRLGNAEGQRWYKLGRKWLENRARRLIEEDGSFSQYSVTYHRMMLDTYSIAEIWRRKHDLDDFSASLYSRLRVSTNWLYQLVSKENGDVPNLGANDGARLLPLTDTDYRDFRPSVQLASSLFANARAYGDEGHWNLPLKWLGVNLPDAELSPQLSVQFDNGGYSLLRRADAFVVLRYPRFRFRPSQADALHVDLWLGTENILRDGGTYSYNDPSDVSEYLSSAKGHNTIEFDDRDQMPRLGKFLYGDWLSAEEVSPVCCDGQATSAGACYTDKYGGRHQRSVILTDDRLTVTDNVSGFKRKAVMRWRLLPCDWRFEGNQVICKNYSLNITANVPITKIGLTSGWESRYYMQKKAVPVLVIEIEEPGELVTIVNFG